MIKVVEHGTPEERAVQDAFFNWQEKGFSSAWASLVALKVADHAQQVEALVGLLREWREITDEEQAQEFASDLCKRTDELLKGTQ